jgi:hypothetical protein
MLLSNISCINENSQAKNRAILIYSKTTIMISNISLVLLILLLMPIADGHMLQNQRISYFSSPFARYHWPRYVKFFNDQPLAHLVYQSLQLKLNLMDNQRTIRHCRPHSHHQLRRVIPTWRYLSTRLGRNSPLRKLVQLSWQTDLHHCHSLLANRCSCLH